MVKICLLTNCVSPFVVSPRSTELDFNWSWFQLRCMQVGGNASAVSTWGQNKNTLSTKLKFYHWVKHTLFNVVLPVWLPVSLLIAWQMSFFSQHGCTSSAANAKYNSRAAQLYREKIKTLASQATRRHGTEVIRTCFFIVLKQLPQCWLPVFAEPLSLTAQTAVSV